MPAEPSNFHNNDAQEENNYNVACPSCGARATCPLSAWILWEAAWDEEAVLSTFPFPTAGDVQGERRVI